MNTFEYYPNVLEALSNLIYFSDYVLNSGDRPYKARSLKDLRKALRDIEQVPFIQELVNELYKSWLFADPADEKMLTSSEDLLVKNIISIIRIKLGVLRDITEQSNLDGRDHVLFIRLPELDSFNDLSKIANEFRKGIEIPILEESVSGEVKILAGDQGSVVLYVSVGTILAIKLVAGICWAAAVIRKKQAEAKIFEMHAKTLELKNDALSTIIEAQEQQFKNILQSEAEALATKYYSHNDPESIERLKLSITSIADLIERGAKILPMNKDEDIQKSFPDYTGKGFIESAIKQIGKE